MGKVIPLPLPVGGMNSRDSLAAMPPNDAVILQDLVPSGTYVETAPPCQEYYDIGSVGCRSLVPYEAGSTATLLAIVGSGSSWDIVDITAPGAPSTLKSAQANGIYAWTMFQSKIILCNGANTPQVYNGATCTDLVATGPTLTTLKGCITFKGRVYYWQASSQSFWYAAAGAYQGTLTEFPIDTITTLGGKITLITTLTRDGGEGADDLFVIVLNTGEVILYQGDDPSSAAAWEMIGKFKMPRPLGVRSAVKVGGNAWVATYEGTVDINRLLSGDLNPYVSDKVGKLMSFAADTASTYVDLVGFIDFPETESYLFIDRDLSGANEQFSETMHMCVRKDSGAWWSYDGNSTEGWAGENVVCGCVWQGKTYFGFDGVFLILRPMDEAVSYAGEVITYPWRTAAANGFAFSVDIYSNALKNWAVVAGVNGEGGYGAFVQPFRGLTGNITMVQIMLGTTTGFWTGRDKKRWIASNIRVKAGGTR